MAEYTVKVEDIQRRAKINMIVAEYDNVSKRAHKLCQMYKKKNALRMSKEDVEDLIQITYIKAIRDIRYFNPLLGSAQNWVFMMLKQILNNANKRAYKYRPKSTYGLLNKALDI